MKRLIVALGIVCALVLSVAAQVEGGGTEVSGQYRGRVRAPELTGGRGWLNTDKPLSLAALKGKVVLLDFWTYGCINCIHIIPELKRLEAKYGNNLVVIGVHSAKFDNEKQTDNIRRIVLRYELEHPIINDADFAIWQSYAVRAWPTQILIDPAGYVIGKVEGEGNYEALDRTIAQTIAEFRKRGELNEQPLKLVLERAKVGDLPLAFPGKILAEAKTNRLFISDSNHNRIIITKLDGTLLEIIGTGERGAADGAFDHATFHRPQGLALDGDTLYIADTENHLIRRADLKAHTVETVAGTGHQLLEQVEGGPARQTAISSPWDLQLIGRTLYIAMAGTHQIWKLDLDKQQLSVFAGSLRWQEARLDGALLDSAFAQPSGLTTDGRATLYVADAEANIIRAISLSDAPPQVRTLVGGDLSDFGDIDASGDDVRLQHPLGVLYANGAVFIADTYNHKIKRLDPSARTVKTLAGTGQPGQTDGASASFYEPGGLSIAGGKLYVADTNNQAIRIVDARTGETSTLMIRGLRPPETHETIDADANLAVSAASAPNSEEIRLAPQRLAYGASASALLINVELPAGYHLNNAAPHRVQISIERGAEHLSLEGDKRSLIRTDKNLSLPLRVPLHTLSTGTSELRLQLTLYYCRADNTGTCRIKTLVWHAPVEVTTQADAPHEIKAHGSIKG